MGGNTLLLEPNVTGKIILLTGISGFIAKHCAVELLTHGYSVRGTVRNVTKSDEVKATLSRHCNISGLELVQADLLSEDGWDSAAHGVYGVLHVASPFPVAEPKDPDELLRPAIDGTMRVLRAAAAAKVQRFVQTSSTVAIAYGHPKDRTRPLTEDDWTNVDGPGISSYGRSKTLAERVARDFMATNQVDFHYSSVNPGFVLGPLLDRDIGSSGEVIQMFLRGKYPGCPRLSFPVVDVRDIAKMHRLALETSRPSGGRYIGVSETAWFIDMMRPIKAKLGPSAKKVPNFELPSLLIRLIGIFDPAARSIVPDLGKYVAIDNRRTREELNLDFIPVTESAPAMAQSLVDLGLV